MRHHLPPHALRLVFVESVCNDAAILKHSYRLKLSNGDYEGQDAEKALADFVSRVRAYEQVYETITDEEASGFEAEFDTNGGRLRYVQTVDAGRKLVASGCNSYLMSHLVALLHTHSCTAEHTARPSSHAFGAAAATRSARRAAQARPRGARIPLRLLSRLRTQPGGSL